MTQRHRGALAAECGAAPGQLASAWLLARGPDVVPIPGIRSAHRVVENAAAAGLELSPPDLARLEQPMPRSAWPRDRFSFAVHQTTRSTV
jgi:aryl-alcohol dehydrogenase-like predicted oxidoreductase